MRNDELEEYKVAIAYLLTCGPTFTIHDFRAMEQSLGRSFATMAGDGFIDALYPKGLTQYTYYVTEKGKDLLR